MPLTVKYSNQLFDAYTPSLNGDLIKILKKPNRNETTSQLVSKIVGQLVIYNEAFLHVRQDKKLVDNKGIEFIECIEHGRVQRVNNNGVCQYVGTDNYNSPLKQDEIHYITGARLGFSTFSLLDQAKQIIELSNTAIRHGSEFYAVSPKNNGWFVSESPLTNPQMVRLQEQIQKQSQEQGGYGLLESKVQLIPTNYSYKEAMSKDTLDSTTRSICSLMGVPQILLGINVDSQTGKDLQETRSVFMTNTINPIVNAIEEALLIAFGNKYVCDFDEKQVLNSSYLDRQKLALEMYKLGLINKNDARIDMQPLSEADGGNHYVIDSNNLTIGDAGKDTNENGNLGD
ncbi:Phage portal protein [compost metagenome]